MYFYVSLSCEEANLNKFGLLSEGFGSFLAVFNEVFGFFSDFVGLF